MPHANKLIPFTRSMPSLHLVLEHMAVLKKLISMDDCMQVVFKVKEKNKFYKHLKLCLEICIISNSNIVK